MTRPDFELLVVDGKPTVRGDCDLANADRIETWLLSFDGQLLDADLSGVTFFDSSALRAFMNVRRRNPKFRIADASPAVVRVLEMTGTRDYLRRARA